MADKNDIRASDGLVVNQAPVGLGQPAGIADAGQSLDELRTDLKARFGARGTPSQWRLYLSDKYISTPIRGR